jgi:16S rRNA (cytosine1402-N4)-methyltransferase
VHQPVLLNEVLDFLDLKKGYTVLDATLGGGGHAEGILKRISPGGRLIAMDADAAAVERASDKLRDFHNSFKFINENFRNLDAVLLREEIRSLDGILFDVGISSYQIEDARRGFSIRHDARLDMRLDGRLKVTAHDIVNSYKEEDLDRIIADLGEEAFHRRIAREIVKRRSAKPIDTTKELAEVVYSAVGRRYRSAKIDPATRTFQALRIAVNDELKALEEGIKKAVSWLKTGRRICVVSFHSLEDRIVKNLFKGYSDLGILKIITKKPVRPSFAEISHNPRSRSAKLRVAERV